MARRIPANRFDDLVRGATEIFSVQGYRRTQMEGVAEAVGVSKATLYLYVESKDALLALCLSHADDQSRVEKPEVLPLPTPPPGALANLLRQRLADLGKFPVLRAALERDRADDIASELRDVLEELYTILETNCRGIRLLERCADHPEIGPVWHEVARNPGRADLARYVESRIRAGQLRPVEHPRLAARIALETIATWAMHIKWDLNPEPFEPLSTKAAVIEQACRGLLP